VTITASTEGGNPTEITTQLQADLEGFDLPNGYRFIYGGEQEETAKTFQDMFVKMIIGIIFDFIYPSDSIQFLSTSFNDSVHYSFGDDWSVLWDGIGWSDSGYPSFYWGYFVSGNCG